MTSDGRLPLDEQLARFEQTLRRNRTLTEVLAQAASEEQAAVVSAEGTEELGLEDDVLEPEGGAI